MLAATTMPAGAGAAVSVSSTQAAGFALVTLPSETSKALDPTAFKFPNFGDLPTNAKAKRNPKAKPAANVIDAEIILPTPASDSPHQELIGCLASIQSDHQSLDSLARQIKDSFADTIRSANSAVEGALITGALLVKAKEQVEHGDWNHWVSLNCGFSYRTARSYMRLATSMPKLDDPKWQRVASLPLREALRAIGTDPTEPPKHAYSKYRANRTDSERSSAVLGKAESALKATRKLIGYQLPVKRTLVDGLRKKLNDALAELDAIEVQAAADAVEGSQ